MRRDATLRNPLGVPHARAPVCDPRCGMRRLGVIAGVFLVAAGFDASAAMGQSCVKAGDTVIRNSVVRLYDDAADRLYGCWLPTRRRVRLDAKVGRWRLANVEGRYVAVGFEGAGSRRGVIVWARLGEKPSRRIAYRFTSRADPPANQLYVSKRGAIAFSAPSMIGYIAPLESGHAPRFSKLDSGPRVVPRSLWADEQAGRLRWRSGGLRKSVRWR